MNSILKGVFISACIMFSLEVAQANSQLDTIVTSKEKISTIDIGLINDLPQIVKLSKNIFLTIDRDNGLIEEIYQGRIKLIHKVVIKNGLYIHFSNNYTVDIIGRYKNNMKDGLWEVKNDSGIWIFEIWEKGKLLNTSKIN